MTTENTPPGETPPGNTPPGNTPPGNTPPGNTPPNNQLPPGDPGWYGQFSPESRDALRKMGVKESPNEVVTLASKHHATVGQNLHAIPGPDATPEQRAAFWKVAGGSDKVEDYRFADLKGIDGVSKDFLTAVESNFAKHQVPKELAKGFLGDMLEHVNGLNAEAIETAGKELQLEEQQLDATWGANSKANRALVYRAGEALGFSKDDIAKLGGAAGYTKVMTTLHKAGEMLREAKRLGGGGIPTMDTDSVEEAKAWLDKSKKDQSMRKKLMEGTDKDLMATRARYLKIVADSGK